MRGMDVRRPALALAAAFCSLLLLAPAAARAAVTSAGSRASAAASTTQTNRSHSKRLLLATDRTLYHAPRVVDPDLVESTPPATTTSAIVIGDALSTQSALTASAIGLPAARAPPTDRWL
ncbi:MAG: hypothetical protein JWM76_1448 [Pseudonocardiales bacterium]|nr:hypothetical protein [Pseudonocardiales bacterium]